MDDDDSTDSDAIPVEYGVRRSRGATTLERRHTSALYPGQFMTMELLLSIAEDALIQCSVLAFMAVLLATHHHRLQSTALQWDRVRSISAQIRESTLRMISDIKHAFEYIMLLLSWVQCHGELALLHAEDLRYFIRIRRHRFHPKKHRTVDELTPSDADMWYRATPRQLRLLLLHWRLPSMFRHPDNGQVFTGEECFLIFLFHLIQGTPYTKMARHTFGGDPRSFSLMFDMVANHLYFTFYNKITGTSLSQWLPRQLDTCRRLVHNALCDTAILETEYVNGEEVDHRWIRHHFDFESFRIFGFMDDYKISSARPQNVWRTLRVSLDLQRSAYSGYLRDHGLKSQLVWLPIGIIGCVFVCEMRQNDNGAQNMSGLNNYLVRLFQGRLLPTGLFPCLFCDGIFAVLATIVPRYVNPTTPEQLINLRLSNLRQQNEHVHARHKELFGLFSIPRRLMLYRKGVQLRRLVVMSFFVQNSYYCLQCNHSRYFGHATPPLEEYIPLDEILRPPPPVNLGEVWDLGYRTTFNV